MAGVVNAVGSIILKPTHLTSHDDFQETIARNLTTAFAIVRAAGKVMTGGGSVVLLSTVAAQVAARLTANPKSLEAARAVHPLSRIGTVDDIAAAACWLLDPATSWVTGQVLSVDGGLSTVRGVA